MNYFGSTRLAAALTTNTDVRKERTMKIVLYSLICICFFYVCNAKSDSGVYVVADIIRAMEKPSTVVATLCWVTGKKKSAQFRNVPIDKSFIIKRQ